MAQLNSPGVSVTVIDESFYTPSAPGTVPLIVVASEENKANSSGTGVAPGTLQINAGQVYLLTSQKELSDTFGVPTFHTDANNNPIHAGELNEYGLQAAYSFLGVSNSAYVVRADLDLGALTGAANPPEGLPVDGTTWIDTTDSTYGIFEWDAITQSFSHKKPIVIDNPLVVDDVTTGPIAGYGTIGTYAIVAVSANNLMSLWYKKPAIDGGSPGWVEVGTDSWKQSRPIAITSGTTFTLPVSPTLTINDTLHTYTVDLVTTPVTTMAGLAAAINDAVASSGTMIVSRNLITGKVELYSTKAVTFAGNSVTAIGFSTSEYLPPAIEVSPHYNIPQYNKIPFHTSSANGNATGSIWIKSTAVNAGANWVVKRYNSTQSAWVTTPVSLYKNNLTAIKNLDASGGVNIAVNTMYLKYNDSEDLVNTIANFKLYRRNVAGPTTITSKIITASPAMIEIGSPHSFTISESVAGSAVFNSPVTVSFNVTNVNATAHDVAVAIMTAVNNAGFVNVSASITNQNRLVITHLAGGDMVITDGTSTPISVLFDATTLNLYAITGAWLASNWSSTVLGTTESFSTPSTTEITSLTASNTLWYDNSISDVDILIHNGTTWTGYLNYVSGTDALGPNVSATEPTTQQNGGPLVNGDLWISTADLANFPLVYKYNLSLTKWVLVDNTDQTTENGILFHDARWSTSGSSSEPGDIASLLTSTYLDPDAPDPALYPHGMLLWNLRRSGYNVKKFVRNYIDTTATNPRQSNEDMVSYYPHRWISEAANQVDGSGSFGRVAQRTVVLQAMAGLINSNQQIRDEDSRVFNLIAAPGYPELIKPLIGLNYDRGLTAFIVGDTPARLTPDATTLSNWGQNVNNAVEDNEVGLVSTDAYLGVFYPWGYTTDNVGNHITVPPSHIMLRTIALSDNVSYPWFAPAGVRRGGITNASAVGYITAEGEFQSVALNNGQRDVLANVHVNPLTYISGTGLVNYGQKTRQLVASALDRINVARLVIYLRVQLARISKPYIFEPNDRQTRNEIKQQIESFLLELVGQRALYDFIVVCDSSNNTPARIDRNELYVDIAIEPVKAVEFIYIPLRLENTGAIANLG